MNAFEQSSGKPGAPSCSDGQQAADPTAQVRALLLVLNQIATTINTVSETLLHAADNGNTLLIWPCLDSLAVAGAVADKALDACGGAPVNGASIFDWAINCPSPDVMRAAGWEAPQPRTVKFQVSRDPAADEPRTVKFQVSRQTSGEQPR